MKYLIPLLSLTAMAMAQDGSSGGAVGGTVSNMPTGQAGAFTSGSNLPLGGSQGQPPSSGSSFGVQKLSTEADARSIELANYLIIALAATVLLLFTYRVIISTYRYIRTLTCLSNDKQRFFLNSNSYFAMFKKYIIYAPLFASRHMKEFRPVAWLNMGIIPNRIQTLFISAFVGMNVALTVIDVPFGGPESPALSKLLARSGTLAVVNLIPMVLLAGKNNPLIWILDIPYDTFNMMHRWLGRVVALEAITHSVAWMVSSYQKNGWSGIEKSIQNSPMIMAGFIAVIAVVVILLQTPSPIRHAFYETFLHFHIALVILALVFLWRHLDGYSQRTYLAGAIVAWIVERTVRLANLLTHSLGRTRCVSTLEPLPGDAVRVTIHLPHSLNFTPGQAMYLTIPSIGLWTSHPFSIAWSSSSAVPITLTRFNSDKILPSSSTDTLPLPTKTHHTISAVIRSRTGFTSRLHKASLSQNTPSAPRLTLVSLPAAAVPNLSSYGTLLLFAAGIGITHQVPRLRSLVQSYSNGAIALRRLTLIWIIQSPEHLEWVRPWMTEILSLPGRRDVLKVLLFVTRPRSNREIQSPSQTVQMYPGRPNVETIVDEEVRNQIGAMGVSVCGTGSLSDDVRSAVRDRSGSRGTNIDFMEANYSW